MRTFHFDQEDISLFQSASHDRNPLHTSVQYARKTPYGNPVVFGILGLLKVLSDSNRHQAQNLESIIVQFRGPMFQATDYEIGLKPHKERQVQAVISDAGKSLLTAKIGYGAGSTNLSGHTAPQSSRTVAATYKLEDLKVGFNTSGSYTPDTTSFRLLSKKLNLPEMGNGASPIAALLLSSYLIGMELPGEGALFSQLKANFTETNFPKDEPIRYEANVASVDDRFGLIEIFVSLFAGDVQFAQMELSAYLRPESPSLNLDRLAAALPPSQNLRGKTALVIGGSRGLGAAIAAGFSSQGCNVIVSYMASQSDAEELSRSIPANWGQIKLEQGDASSAEWCKNLRGLVEQSGGIDFVVCNAVPSIPNLPFGLETLSRGQQFVDASIAMVTTPLAALLPTLDKQGGTAVVMSTIWAADDCHDVPPGWHHYIMSKKAIEGLIRQLAIGPGKARYLLVRPPRLLTDQTNTVAGHFDSLPVEIAASTIVRKLMSDSSATRYTLLSEFESAAVA